MRTYTIVMPYGTEIGRYNARTPRQAALKAVKVVTSKDNVEATFKLRELGTKKLHVFTGHTESRKAPEIRPEWMPEIVRVSVVRKVRVEKVDKIGSALVESDAITPEQLKKAEGLPEEKKVI